MRRALLWTAGGILAALAVAAVAVVALSYGWQRDWLRRQLESRLADALETPIEIGSVDGVLHRDVTLRALRVGEPAQPLLTASSLRFRPGRPLLGPTPALTLDELTLAGAHATLRRSPGGAWPWQGAAAEGPDEESAWPFLLRLRSVVVEDGLLELVGGADEAVRIEVSGGLSEAELGAEPSVGELHVSFTASGPTRHHEPWLNGRGRGSYGAGRWRLAELRVEGPVLELEGQGSGDLAAIDAARLSLRVPSIVALAERVLGDVPAIGGGVQLSADLHGAYRWPQGSLILDARDLSAEGLELGDVHLEARSPEEGLLRIDALRLEHGLLEATADPGADVVAGTERTVVEAFRLRSADGRGTLSIDASVPRAAGESIPAIGRHPGTRLALRSSAWPLAMFEPLWSRLGLELVGSLDANFVIAGAPAGPTVQGGARLSDARLAHAPASAEGIELELTLDGAIATPRVSATGVLGRLVVGEQLLGALDFAARSNDGRTLIFDRLNLRDGPVPLRVLPEARLHLADSGFGLESFAIESEGQRIALSGGLSPTRARALRVELTPLDVGRTAEILRALGLAPAGVELSGRLVGQLVWDGPPGRPELAGDLVWSDARLGDFEFERIDARGETRESEVRITSEWMREGVSALSFGATLPSDRILVAPRALLVDPRASFEARADRFELGALSAFLPPTVSGLGGVLTARIDARSGAPGPSLSGHATIEEGSVKLAALAGQTLAPIRARLSLAGDGLVLEELQIGNDVSGVRGRGEARLDGMEPRSIDLNLAFEAFPVEAPGLVRGTLSGPLRLSGEPGALDLTGDLALEGLNIQIPESEDALLKEIRVVSSDGEDADLEIRERDAAAALLDPLRMDLSVAIARGSWARGQGADVELRGALAAKKERGLPLGFSGKVETVRGTYEIYGRRFRIERGEAILDGADEIDPVLDIRALHRVRGVRIIAIVEGRLSEPRLRFESIPELSETDIASYLLLGQPASSAGGDQQPALDAVAARLAAGAAVRELERMFGGALPVDLIDVRMEEEDGESEINAGVGKYFGERLFLHYEREFSHEPVDELRAEYQLTPHWSVESSVSSEGETGVDLIFEVEY
jgi:autotransporter translocation and assembly factor TamB